jgi:transposase
MGKRNAAGEDPAMLEERRLQAADLFEQDFRQSEIARLLGVSRQAVKQWHDAWLDGGPQALLSKGPGGSSYLTAEQEQALDLMLRKGPTAFGWDDQRWTLARVRKLIEERFEVHFRELSGVWRLLNRMGWSWQVPARRAVERDEEAIAAWRTETWPAAKQPLGSRAPGSASRTKPERG